MGKKRSVRQKHQSQQSPSPLKQYRSFSEANEQARRIPGERIAVEELVKSGDEILVKSYRQFQSKFKQGQYVIIEMEYKGAPRWLSTASEAVRDQLMRTQGAMPYRCRIEERSATSGRKYLTLE
jgi:hypothetical protein